LSGAHAPPAALIRVEADVEHADALVQSLGGFVEAEEVSLDGGRVEVHVWARGDTSEAVVRVLDVVDAWLVSCDRDSTFVHVEGRSYRVAAPAKPIGNR
jgi:hypothetical protein